MFNKHLFKVVIGFCGMIIIGLVVLVVIDSFKQEDNPVNVSTQVQADTASKTATSTNAPLPVKKSLN
ncbi:MAG: hypothetical protein KGI58_00935 [Patescibacteria group bacterium]|nr:hypothetical protein [Patescibacteria group bacterium]